MHCELIVPGLLPDGEDVISQALGDLRLPALERLLARSRRTLDARITLEPWLAWAFDGDSEAEIPAGALTVAALGGEAGSDAWMRADPAHLRLNRDQLVLVPSAAFGLQATEAEAIAETLNTHFAGKLEFFALSPHHWCVRLPKSVAIRTEALMEVAGKDINHHLPTGKDAKPWHSALNEIQMLLHEHPVNEAREARGEPPVNSVWLWGMGKLPEEAEATFHAVTSDDPVAVGLAKVAGLRHRPLPVGAEEWLGRLPEDGRELLVLDGLRLPLALSDFEAWRERLAGYEEKWFAPLLAALTGGRIGMVTIRIPDGEEMRSFESTRNDQRHFWRRSKALATYC